MDFLGKIVEEKKKEIMALAASRPLEEFERDAFEAPPPLDFRKSLEEGISIIAEVKRKSPSRGQLAEVKDPRELACIYQRHGARAVSVLTDASHFGGSLDDLRTVRAAIGIPVLRKDFIMSPVQVYESRSAGADAFLLIVSILDQEELETMIELGESLGMTPLVEIHTAEELNKAIAAGAKTIGINNRNLQTFEIDITNCMELIEMIPAGTLAVAESGIMRAADMRTLAAAGFQAFLIGEALVVSMDPGGTIEAFLEAAKSARVGGSFAG